MVIRTRFGLYNSIYSVNIKGHGWGFPHDNYVCFLLYKLTTQSAWHTYSWWNFCFKIHVKLLDCAQCEWSCWRIYRRPRYWVFIDHLQKGWDYYLTICSLKLFWLGKIISKLKKLYLHSSELPELSLTLIYELIIGFTLSLRWYPHWCLGRAMQENTKRDCEYLNIVLIFHEDIENFHLLFSFYHFCLS